MDRIAVCGTVDPSSILGRRTQHKMEGWPSGSWRTPRKRVGESPQRFEPSTLRTKIQTNRLLITTKQIISAQFFASIC